VARVVILQGPGAGREFELHGETVLGRLESNGIPIEDTLASREHARIEVRDGRYVLVDLGSSNGTRVNGKRITEHALRTGDRIVIGTARMEFDDPAEEPASAESAPEPDPEPERAPEPAVEAAPRAYAQQYWLLLGCMAIAIGCLTVWERAHVTGKDVYGFQMIAGAFTLLFGAYGTVEAVLGILQRRLRVVGAVAAGTFGLLYGLKAFGRILSHEGFRSYAALESDGATTHQAVIARWIGQIGPGVWLTLFGAVVIAAVFGRALLVPARNAARADARRR